MAKLVTPGREVIKTMQELGLGAWIRGGAYPAGIRTSVGRDEIRLTRTLPGRALTLRDETAADDAGVARLLRTLGHVAPEGRRTAAHPAPPVRPPQSVPGVRGSAAGLLLAGLGLLALSALLGIARR